MLGFSMFFFKWCLIIVDDVWGVLIDVHIYRVQYVLSVFIADHLLMDIQRGMKPFGSMDESTDVGRCHEQRRPSSSWRIWSVDQKRERGTRKHQKTKMNEMRSYYDQSLIRFWGILMILLRCFLECWATKWAKRGETLHRMKHFNKRRCINGFYSYERFMWTRCGFHWLQKTRPPGSLFVTFVHIQSFATHIHLHSTQSKWHDPI